MAHDFKAFPELTNSQMGLYYFESPHKQITEDFNATVVNVHDGDTITVRWVERDFDFPIRFNNTAAPEMNEAGGKEAQQWLEERVLGKEVQIHVDPKRVEKWGRLLGAVFQGGQDVGDEEVMLGLSKTWAQRNEGKIK
jgi:endonuclease YncB( thermonuclease family)